jgi:hypothetical protein
LGVVVGVLPKIMLKKREKSMECEFTGSILPLLFQEINKPCSDYIIDSTSFSLLLCVSISKSTCYSRIQTFSK